MTRIVDNFMSSLNYVQHIKVLLVDGLLLLCWIDQETYNFVKELREYQLWFHFMWTVPSEAY